ncbi:MAG TPA: glycosyltransferase family 2 protein [Candidatus Didemnitutus sp.]|nr:glycosyltransferase family 2 protein [Candidatus Didemnitutus sp.]
MQLVAVSVVKNEADIIEAFVRHTGAWVDRHLILDHDSTDGTREILGHLAREGLAIEIYADNAIGNLQQERSNHLTRIAADRYGADWILPLDADEFVSGPGRPALEQALAASPAQATSWPLLNHALTGGEDTAEKNPVLRIRTCERQVAPTRKILVPRALALATDVIAGKGSHGLARAGKALPTTALPEKFCLAHFPERSVPQIATRITLAELQKLSRGSAHAGVDSHYRLPFQTLAANPALFARAFLRPESELRISPFEYLGGALRHTTAAPEWERLACGILPYLEKLAVSHGRMLDAEKTSSPTAETRIRTLTADELAPASFAGHPEAFRGFKVVAGLGPDEGPVPAAYLPQFRWGTAPETILALDAGFVGPRSIEIEALTYSPNQVLEILCGDTTLLTHAFGRVEQRERIRVDLPVGATEVRLRYREALQSERDKRALAVIFLSLRVV